MRIGEICTRNVVRIEPGQSLRAAAELMRKRHVGSVVVVDEPDGERAPVGIITDRDIVLAVVAPGVDPAVLTVGDVMTRALATCAESDDVFGAIEAMRRRGVRRLPVLDDKGVLAGMVSADDIYGALGVHLQELAQALTREQAREMALRT